MTPRAPAAAISRGQVLLAAEVSSSRGIEQPKYRQSLSYVTTSYVTTLSASFRTRRTRAYAAGRAPSLPDP